MKRKNQRKTVAAWIVFGVACMASILIGGKVIWMNIGGLLSAVLGLFTLLGYSLSPTSDPANIRTYVPLNIFDPSFDGAHTVLATQSAAPEITDEFLYGIGPEYRRYSEAVKTVCWTSLAVWAFLALMVVLSVLLVKRRPNTSAQAPILLAWSFLAMVPAMCRIMLWGIHSFDSAVTFFVLGGCSLAVFAMAWNKKGDSDSEQDGQHSTPEAQEQESETPSGL